MMKFYKKHFLLLFLLLFMIQENKSGLSMQCACKWLLKFDLRDFYTVL